MPGGPGRRPPGRFAVGARDEIGGLDLLAGTDAGVRTFRVGRVTGVPPTDAPALRPEGFDLTTAWEESSATVEAPGDRSG